MRPRSIKKGPAENSFRVLRAGVLNCPLRAIRRERCVLLHSFAAGDDLIQLYTSADRQGWQGIRHYPPPSWSSRLPEFPRNHLALGLLHFAYQIGPPLQHIPPIFEINGMVIRCAATLAFLVG